MGPMRMPAIGRLTLRPARGVLRQRRWARVHDVRFVATTQPSAAVVDRYRARLEQKARQEGHDGIDALKSAYAGQIEAQRRRDAVELPTPTTMAQPAPHPPPPPPPSPPRQPASTPGAAVKTLSDMLDLEKARALPDKELAVIWRLRHADSRQKMCAVMPASTYQAMEEAARRCPQFVVPVPHEDQGADIHFLQWTFDAGSNTSTVLFTQLAEYKARGEFSQPHTSITHHLDLAADRGLVLMQGQFMDERGIRPEHARWLVACLQRFYGGPGELQGEGRARAKQRRKLLEWFSTGDARFSVEKLMDEAERLG